MNIDEEERKWIVRPYSDEEKDFLSKEFAYGTEGRLRQLLGRIVIDIKRYGEVLDDPDKKNSHEHMLGQIACGRSAALGIAIHYADKHGVHSGPIAVYSGDENPVDYIRYEDIISHEVSGQQQSIHHTRAKLPA